MKEGLVVAAEKHEAIMLISSYATNKQAPILRAELLDNGRSFTSFMLEPNSFRYASVRVLILSYM